MLTLLPLKYQANSGRTGPCPCSVTYPLHNGIRQGHWCLTFSSFQVERAGTKLPGAGKHELWGKCGSGSLFFVIMDFAKLVDKVSAPSWPTRIDRSARGCGDTRGVCGMEYCRWPACLPGCALAQHLSAHQPNMGD